MRTLPMPCFNNCAGNCGFSFSTYYEDFFCWCRHNYYHLFLHPISFANSARVKCGPLRSDDRASSKLIIFSSLNSTGRPCMLLGVCRLFCLWVARMAPCRGPFCVRIGLGSGSGMGHVLERLLLGKCSLQNFGFSFCLRKLLFQR